MSICNELTNNCWLSNGMEQPSKSGSVPEGCIMKDIFQGTDINIATHTVRTVHIQTQHCTVYEYVKVGRVEYM